MEVSRGQRQPGQGHVHRVAFEGVHQLVRLERGLPYLERLLEFTLHQVAELAHARPLLRRELGDAAEQVGELSLPAKEAHAGFLEACQSHGRVYGGQTAGVDGA